MKRATIVLCAVVGLLGYLGGCQREPSDSKSGSSSTTQNAQRQLKIGVSIPAFDHGWTAGVGYWAQREMNSYPDVNWVYQTANEPAKQIADIETMLAQGVDGLVILATESAPLTPVAERARQRGVYIVNVDRGFLKPVANVYVQGDNKAFGRKSAQFIVQRLNGIGQIVILRGIPSTVDTDRYDAAMDVFNANPGIKVLGTQPGMWNQQKALDVMQTFLTQFPQIDAVWAADDDMAMGVEKAIREAGRQNQMWIFPGAGMKQIVQRVMDKDPMYPADITYPPAMIAAGIDIAVAGLRHDGKIVAAAERIPEHLGVTRQQLEQADAGVADQQKNVTLDVQLITPDNASRFYFPDSVY
jgi:ribose transport system substrate-binding protein